MIKLKGLIIERLSPKEAEDIFRKFGVNNALSLPKPELKKKYKELVLKHHPDKGGKNANMQIINAAFDVLSKDGGKSFSTPDDSYASTDETNIDYVKRKAWEISGKPPQTPQYECTFWNWDGSFFRGVFTVYATPEKLFEISQMMVKWDNYFKSVAVFVGFPNHKNSILLVNLRGEDVNPRKWFTHDSFNRNPGNDQEFVRMLRKEL